jgi:type VI secretion system protein ImpA
LPEIDFKKLTEPLSAADPCGPDLDFEGDDDYLDLLANAEMALPSTFFMSEEEGGRPYDLSKIDIDQNVQKIVQLLGRTRDLRLFILLARFLVFNRDLRGFLGSLETIASFLSDYWDSLHPRAEGEGLTARRMALSMLDLPTVSLPLQYVPLCSSRRSGMITYRAYAIARGVEAARPGESVLTAGAILQALRDTDAAEIEPIAVRFANLPALLERIRTTCLEKGGVEAMPSFDKHVMATTKEINDLINLVVVPETGVPLGQATATGANETDIDLPAGRAPAGAIKNAVEMRSALDAVATYFRAFEPSSAVLPLVVQAQQLHGKSFLEAISVLVPDLAPQVAYPIGGNQFFPLPIERLSTIMPTGEASEEAPSIGGDGHAGLPTDAARPQPLLSSRAQALAQLDAVIGYLRMAEPSSPLPFLLSRATSLADKDFLSVLKSLLPENSLRVRGTDI